MAKRQGHELVLDSAVEEVVRRLLTRVPGPTSLVADGKALAHVPRGMGRASDVHDLARVHEIVERTQRLFRVDLEGWTVQLVQVDVVGAQAAQRGFARLHDVPARGSPIVAVRTGRQADLR